jgi:hypothetical protein
MSDVASMALHGSGANYMCQVDAMIYFLISTALYNQGSKTLIFCFFMCHVCGRIRLLIINNQKVSLCLYFFNKLKQICKKNGKNKKCKYSRKFN